MRIFFGTTLRLTLAVRGAFIRMANFIFGCKREKKLFFFKNGVSMVVRKKLNIV